MEKKTSNLNLPNFDKLFTCFKNKSKLIQDKHLEILENLKKQTSKFNIKIGISETSHYQPHIHCYIDNSLYKFFLLKLKYEPVRVLKQSDNKKLKNLCREFYGYLKKHNELVMFYILWYYSVNKNVYNSLKNSFIKQKIISIYEQLCNTQNNFSSLSL